METTMIGAYAGMVIVLAAFQQKQEELSPVDPLLT